MNVNDLVSRAAKYDEALAHDIQRFVGNRQFGLVYEESKPEFVRLYKKAVVVGDTVNILPPRGEMEKMTSDTDEHEIKWRIVSITENTAHLESLESGNETDASIDDLVAYVRFDQSIYAGLKENDRVERGGDKPYQVVINGENFHALEALMFAYQGKVDCIYIDPPYNTGATDWKYNNNYVSKDDIYRHSKWLTFMEDRLNLAKKLLNPNNSVLILTIDEKEYLHIGLLLEQMFPEANIQMVSSVINSAGVSRGTEFSRSNEYIYFVKRGSSAPSSLPLSDVWRGNMKANKKDKLVWNQLMRAGTNARRIDRPNLFYPLYVSIDGLRIEKIGDSVDLSANRDSIKPLPDTRVVWPIRSNGEEGNWQIGQSTLSGLIEKGFVRLGSFTDKGMAITYLKSGEQSKVENGVYPIVGHRPDGSVIEGASEEERVFVPGTQWDIPSHNATYYGSQLLNKFWKDSRFTFPKSLYAVTDALRFFISDNPDALVVDFFAGSGTTLHAVNVLNAVDHGDRRCICITNNEVSAEESKILTQKMLRPGEPEWEARGIAHYVTWQRTICSIIGKAVDGSPLVGNYGVEREDYILDYDSAVVSKKTGKQLNTRIYKKATMCDYPELAEMKMSDGFAENAIFFDLEYLEPSVVQADMAFNEIAPLLWLKAGSKGRIIQHGEKYDISENYAVLFDYRYIGAFTREVQKKPEVKTLFIVTDHDARYRDMCAAFPDRNVTQLYESYLRSFEILGEG